MKNLLKRILGRRAAKAMARVPLAGELLGLARDLVEWPRYLRDFIRYRRLGGQVTHLYPILSDYRETAGVSSGHYFHQDLLVAKFIAEDQPARHVDIGSRIDGFVAHVASFRPIEIFDLRDLPDTNHSNISFKKADFMKNGSEYSSYADSVSCLHTIEHFGLGRYGDSLDPLGHFKGFQSLIELLEAGGLLYLSFPIGSKNEIHFNAQRVFEPREVLSWPGASDHLSLERFDFVDDAGDLVLDYPLLSAVPPLVEYGCGIYTFRKLIPS